MVTYTSFNRWPRHQKSEYKWPKRVLRNTNDDRILLSARRHSLSLPYLIVYKSCSVSYIPRNDKTAVTQLKTTAVSWCIHFTYSNNIITTNKINTGTDATTKSRGYPRRILLRVASILVIWFVSSSIYASGWMVPFNKNHVQRRPLLYNKLNPIWIICPNHLLITFYRFINRFKISISQ